MEYQDKVAAIIRDDPNVELLVSAGAIPNSNQSAMYIRLKGLKNREPMHQVVSRLLDKANEIPGVQVFLRPTPLISLDVGTSTSMANYQYTLQGINPETLYSDTEKMINAMKASHDFSQVVSDMHNNAPYVNISIDRDRAYDLNVSADTLEFAFDFAYAAGRTSLINGITDQYYVTLETIPDAYKNPSVLDKLYISATTSSPIINTNYPTQIHLSEIVKMEEGVGPLSIAHFNTLPSATISFDIPRGHPLGSALASLDGIAANTLSQGTIGHVQGSADVFKASFRSLGFLFIITFFLIYIILGILYENFIHPLTVMSALPPAALGAVLTLILFGEPLSLYAFVGIIMLLGIVLKNGIMLVDFASEAINEGKTVIEAIQYACETRLRPILMTTFAAMMGAVPIALGLGGATAQSRRSLGLVIVGGLIISQVLTLFFTPIIFIYLEKIREALNLKKKLTVSG